MDLSPEQQAVVDGIVASGQKIIKLSGAAGTGKSTVIKALETRYRDVEIVTPTNKAATVLRKKGCRANTAFSIFFCPEKNDGAIEYEVAQSKTTPPTYEEIVKKPATLRFIPNDKLDSLQAPKRSHATVVILDEASMVQTWMIKALARMSDQLILVGDERQLAPINDRQHPRGYFNSLPADFVLTQNFRQTDPKLLAALKLLDTVSGQKKEVWAAIPKVETVDFTSFIQAHRPKIICWKNATRHQLNTLARAALGISGWPQIGEPVIACSALFSLGHDVIPNGTEGVIDSVASRGFIARFNNHLVMHNWDSEFNPNNGEIQLAYAITVHKAQGSEYPVTLVINEAGVLQVISDKINTATEAKFIQDAVNDPEIQALYEYWKEHKLTAPEASRRWTYTALTRGHQVFHATAK